MAKEKKIKLRELGNTQLLLQFQIATRKAWEVFLKQPHKVALRSAEFREEQRISRELVRRLRMIPAPIKAEEHLDQSGGGGLFSGGGTEPGGGMFSRGS